MEENCTVAQAHVLGRFPDVAPAHNVYTKGGMSSCHGRESGEENLLCYRAMVHSPRLLYGIVKLGHFSVQC